ncbi:MAG: hypothetical protein ACO34J_13230 [Prochlorothrix sp.]
MNPNPKGRTRSTTQNGSRGSLALQGEPIDGPFNLVFSKAIAAGAAFSCWAGTWECGKYQDEEPKSP